MVEGLMYRDMVGVDGKCKATGLVVNHRVYNRHLRSKMTPEQRAHDLATKKAYYHANKAHLQERNRVWVEKNREKLKKYASAYAKKRRESDPQFRISQYLQVKLAIGVRKVANGYYPEVRKPFIGCTWRELKAHFERLFGDGMSWENYGTLWTVDHIISRSEFDLTKKEEQLMCFHYSNLRPLRVHFNNTRELNTPRGIRPETDSPTPALVHELEHYTSPCRGSIGRTDAVPAYLAPSPTRI